MAKSALMAILFIFQWGYLSTAAAEVVADKSNPPDLGVQIQKEYRLSKTLMLKNISRKDTLPGVVVAATSTDNPNYYFHWIRDAALTIDVVVTLYGSGEGNTKELRRKILDYVSLSRRNQLTPNLSGGLGEPKFNVDGSAFADPWGRPQSDGPALRAIALIHFANVLINQGEKNLVTRKLFDKKNPTESVIKADLEYISQNWRLPCFDVWEETKGNHFYTLMVQRKALIEGAHLARLLGDEASASNYDLQKNEITQALGNYWNSKDQFIFESLNQVASHSKSGLDVAVILGVLHGYADDHFFSPANDMVLSTSMKLKESFDQIYKVNETPNFVSTIGRYPEDWYNGDGDSLGNPWFLTTLAYAELLYRVRAEYLSAKVISVNALNKSFLDFISPGYDFKLGQILQRKDHEFKMVIAALQDQGDNFFKRTLHHIGSDGSMSEEINRDTGAMQGAQNLTWSYVSFIRAAKWRQVSR